MGGEKVKRMDLNKCSEALRLKGGWTPPQHEVTIETLPCGSRTTKDEHGVMRFYAAPGTEPPQFPTDDPDRYVLTLRLENMIIMDGRAEWTATDEFLETLREYIAAVKAGKAGRSAGVEVFEGERGTRLTVTPSARLGGEEEPPPPQSVTLALPACA